MVSMPFIGRIPFLPLRLKEGRLYRSTVSMPFIGRIPFLLSPGHSWTLSCNCVNALHRANPISTGATALMRSRLSKCVNALHRANPISTVPSQNPHKQGVSEAISAGNSQNILKQSISGHFFGSRSFCPSHFTILFHIRPGLKGVWKIFNVISEGKEQFPETCLYLNFLNS